MQREGFKANEYIYNLIQQVQLNWLHSIKLLIIKADVDYDKKKLYLCRLDIKASMFFLMFPFSLHCQIKSVNSKFIKIHHTISFLLLLPLFPLKPAKTSCIMFGPLCHSLNCLQFKVLGFVFQQKFHYFYWYWQG